MIGQLLDGKYEIVRLIGEGGMGAVYEARNTREAKRVAVKVINDEAVAKDEVLIQRFEREAYAAKKVLSPYIVEILEAGHDATTGHPYMVMEMLDGENALQLLKRLGPLPPQLAIRIGVQTCEGLAKAHGVGVVHRDIKPANLFLTVVSPNERVVKLLDFGVAKFKMEQASESDNESLTRTGSMLGSPMYMSPEQARGLKTIDHRADVWSLGIVMHQLLTGRVPHQDIDGLGELIITICSEPPPLVSDNAPWVSKKLAAVIAQALKLSTDARFQSAKEFGSALRGCLQGDEKIITSMLVRLTEEDRAARPDAAPPKTPATTTLPLAHDATVALADVEAEIEKAQAAKALGKKAAPSDGNGSAPRAKAPSTKTEPIPAMPDLAAKSPAPAPAAAGDLAATVALPENIDLAALGLPPEDAPQKPLPRGAANDKPANDKPAPSEKRRERDASALSKHRDAQRAAIDAARLGEEESPSNIRLLLAILAGVAIGGGSLALYYWKFRAEPVAPSASVSAPATPSESAPAPAPAPTPKATEGEPAPSGSAAVDRAGPAKVKISPPYANVTVDGKPAKIVDGAIRIEGAPDSTHTVRVAIGKDSKNFTVKLTEGGPQPDSIVFQPPVAPRPPAPAPPE